MRPTPFDARLEAKPMRQAIADAINAAPPRA
jgi:endo-1,4-beta-xylanase